MTEFLFLGEEGLKG